MKEVLKTYWRYSQGIRKFGIATILVMIVGLLLRNTLRPLAFSKVLDGLAEKSDHIIWLVFIFASIAVLANIAFSIADFLISRFEATQMKILRNASFAEMIKHPLSFFAHTFSGSLVTKQRRFVGSAEFLFDDLTGQYLFMVVQVVGSMIVIASISIPMMIGFFIWMILYCTLILLAADKRMRLDTIEASTDSQVTGSFADPISNISLIKLFGTHEREKKNFRKITEKHYDALMASWNFSNKQNIFQRFFSTSLHIGSLGGGVYLWTKGEFSIGQIVLVTTYASVLADCLWDFGRSIRRGTKAIADAKEMVEIINTPPSINDHLDAIDNPVLTLEQRSITFKDVSFAYDNNVPVFERFSLEIPSGQKVAIIGSTGAGKSTLVQLMLRNVEPVQGIINVGPYNICTDITNDSLKTLVTCVPQNTDMFHRSIFENIAYGKEDATIDQVCAVAKKAHIHEFIIGQPNGYHAKVGERGIMLSGGQKQRIAIARALLHDAPILILDEATASLDNVTEKEIQNIFEESLSEKTVIVIAHRLSTIRNCDRIIVFEDGGIKQDGNHDSLVKDTTGIYYKMLHSHTVATKEEVYS